MQSSVNTQGFTLIELVTMILIIGILAATSVPRFANLIDQANEAEFGAIRAAFTSGVNIAHGKALASSSSMPGSITMGGVPVDISSEGWPAVSQADSNCDFVALYDPFDMMPPIHKLQAYVLSFSVIRLVHALPGGGGGGGGGDPCSVLELVVSSESLGEWSTSVSGNSATFTDPSGRAFTYNETTGEVN